MDKSSPKYYEKMFKHASKPIIPSPYDKSRPYKEGKRGIITSKGEIK